MFKKTQIYVFRGLIVYILKYCDKSVNIDHIKDPITRSIEQYKNHLSVVAIKSKNTNKYFKFNIISKSEFEKEKLN